MNASLTREEYAGVGLMLLGELRASDELGPVPARLQAMLEPTSRVLPPQYYRLGNDGYLGNWINAAAAIEAQALHEIAYDLLTELRRLYVGLGAQFLQRALDAFIWLRKGRIARTSGRLDDAEFSYREALRLVPSPLSDVEDIWWTDVLPHVWIGLGILAVGRGNYPVAERETAKVLDPRVPSIWRITGHLQMTIILRKRVRAVAALEHIWAAFDLMEEHDTRRAEALVPLGEVLMGLDEHMLSLQAHLAALAMQPVSRVQAAALCGVLTALSRAQLPSLSELNEILTRSAWARQALAGSQTSDVMVDLLTHVEKQLSEVPSSLVTSEAGSTGVVRGLTRHDQSILARSLAELLYSSGRRNEAMEWLSVVETIADRHGFHERKFEVDSLRASWGHGLGSTTNTETRAARPRASRGHSVWARMAELEELATLDSGVSRR